MSVDFENSQNVAESVDFENLQNVAEYIHNETTVLAEHKEEKDVILCVIRFWKTIQNKASQKIKKHEKLLEECEQNMLISKKKVEDVYELVEDGDISKIIESAATCQKGSSEYKAAKKRFQDCLKNRDNSQDLFGIQN